MLYSRQVAGACLLIALCASCATKTPGVPQKADTAIEITTTIKAALVDAADVDAASIRIILANNNIVLSGFVSGKSELDEIMRLSEMHARGYPVTNKIVIESPVFK